MTEVWKVVNAVGETLESSMVGRTAFGCTYKKNVTVKFNGFLPCLAFKCQNDAEKFWAFHKQHKDTLQIWKAEATILPHPVKSILPYLLVEDTKPQPNDTVVTFWKSKRWHRPGDAIINGWRYVADAPPGTIACTSITLLERCDD